MNRFRQPRFEAVTSAGGPKLISILSGKGGVGKSVLTFNLAERIADLGYRTLIVDADAACGNIHILANIDARQGLSDFASGRLSLAEAIYELNEKLFLLPGVSEAPSDVVATAGTAARTVGRLREEGRSFDVIVLDHSSGISEPATVMAHGSDANVLVLVPELTSISDCYGLYKHLLKANPSIDCRLLLNRVESPEEAEYIRAKFFVMADTFLGRIPGYLGSILESAGFRQAVARQLPVAKAAPQDQSLQDLTKIRDSLGGLLTPIPRRAETAPGIAINKTPMTADIRG